MSIAASAQPQWLTTVDIIKRLVRLKRITQEEGEKFLSSPRSKSELALHPIEQVVNSGLIDHNSGKAFDLDELSSWLAKEAGQPYFHIDPLKIDARGVASLMSFAYAQRHRILGVEIHKDHVVIASAEPFVTGWEDNLRHVVRKDIKRVVANPADIRRFTVEFYRLATSVDKAIGGRGETSAAIGNFEQLLELGNVANPDANDQHIVNIVDWLLQYAFDQRASDIHIEPRREIGQVRFRIDGVLHNVYELPMQVSMAVVSRLKILGRLNVAEKRKPQDGRIKTKNPDGLEIELRLSTLPTAFGEKLVMRVFDPDVLLRSFSDLGFGQDDSRRWNSMTSQPNGIILVTGPTGSGKTTTLYSTLKSLATSEVNVCSIEDPIEMVEPAFNQMQVQSGIGVTFASGVRALLRQDPDIIMVGEIRDLETAEMAIQAALTGHLVLSTLHTNDAPSAITRLLELGVPGYLVKATVLGVMAQRLVRVLCPNCKEPTTIDDKDWQNLIQPWKASKPDHACAPVGCLECRNTGYRGRAGVYEVMLLSESVKESINEHCDLERIRKVAVKEGMRTLRLSGAQKVANGMTTIDEVLRVTPSSSLAII
ncbi:Type II secretory pathway, ATPase PulE/Tfp pilus assembly pathway, ATPase PilB [Hahella chejuensis KCTC 2396]|uniref:Type II secretory pathway, ATPase PulE/Tfp pilus assembly pathway, ATPase PilB n=1 Tax=Hahella chejuensis (strain KCTC 2396) TaxID=349521 RepID=Q2SKY2_HAHCH|nr:GspE/PulE family protein [Hahella chejuensis]ABC28692.1 Type II secretory pathway, ATPase PulE/Tfp pilus assembly pathway, ATPase PilB [Hahella chejuensis KCTC 2396]